MTVLLSGQLPSGKNQVRTAWTPDKQNPGKMKPHKYPDARFEQWRAEAFRQAIAQIPPKSRSMITMPSRLVVEYWPGDLRTRDLPGMLDALCHFLVYAKFIEDDKLVCETVWKLCPLDREHPRARLQLCELQGAMPL